MQNNIIDITERLKDQEIFTGYIIVNMPVVLFYDQIGELKPQIFDGGDGHVFNHVLTVESGKGEIKFLCPDEENQINAAATLTYCREMKKKQSPASVTPLRSEDGKE